MAECLCMLDKAGNNVTFKNSKGEKKFKHIIRGKEKPIMNVDMSGDWSYQEYPDVRLSDFDYMFRALGYKYNVNWIIIACHCWQESQFDPNAVNWNPKTQKGTKATGLFQFLPSTWKGLMDTPLEEAKKPAEQHKAYIKCADTLFKRYAHLENRNDQILLMLQCWHDGSCRKPTTSWKTRTPNQYGYSDKSKEYVPSIMTNFRLNVPPGTI